MLSLAFCRLPFEVLLSIVDDNVGTLNPELCGICPSWGGASVILTGVSITRGCRRKGSEMVTLNVKNGFLAGRSWKWPVLSSLMVEMMR